MKLRKRLSPDTLVSARYVQEPDGITLDIRHDGDKFYNAVATIEIVDGVPQLTIHKDVVAHYGLRIVEKDSGITEW